MGILRLFESLLDLRVKYRRPILSVTCSLVSWKVNPVELNVALTLTDSVNVISIIPDVRFSVYSISSGCVLSEIYSVTWNVEIPFTCGFTI